MIKRVLTTLQQHFKGLQGSFISLFDKFAVPSYKNESKNNVLLKVAIFYLLFLYLHTSFFVFLTTEKIKFSVKDFLSKCDQIHMKLRIWLHLLKKS